VLQGLRYGHDASVDFFPYKSQKSLKKPLSPGNFRVDAVPERQPALGLSVHKQIWPGLERTVKPMSVPEQAQLEKIGGKACLDEAIRRDRGCEQVSRSGSGAKDPPLPLPPPLHICIYL